MNKRKISILEMLLIFCCFLLLFSTLAIAQHPVSVHADHRIFSNDSTVEDTTQITLSRWIKVKQEVRIENYFEYIDSLVCTIKISGSNKLREHHIAHQNAWIIDTLSSTDYYVKKLKDSFVFDQKKMIVLKEGDSIEIPGTKDINDLEQLFSMLYLDINIPEYRLRIYKSDSLLFSFPIRIGQNKKKYLAMSKRVTNLRTQTGTGKIVAHHKNPVYYNPVNMKRYKQTIRDDGQKTLLPRIPWLETEINGVRNGQMIHPTTNPVTLGKAYSNGCIGIKEQDAWIIYYFAPIGTPIYIRYDTVIETTDGKTIILEDIYNYLN
ncbi:L,D-transpeptidase [Flavobacteriaceae bacterium M23B6Z8]